MIQQKRNKYCLPNECKLHVRYDSYIKMTFFKKLTKQQNQFCGRKCKYNPLEILPYRRFYKNCKNPTWQTSFGYLLITTILLIIESLHLSTVTM